MYATGSLNCSAVGLYVGASCKPNMRWGLGGRLFGALCPLRSTVAKSSGAALRALKGMVLTPFGCAPFAEGVAIPPMRDRGAEGPPSDMPPSVATRKVVIVAPVGGPPGGIKSTIVTSAAAPSVVAEKGGFRIRNDSW